MKAYVVQYTEHADGILGIYLTREEAEVSQRKYKFETYIEEHDIGTEKIERKNHGENIFEEYLPYVKPSEITSKGELLRHFLCFLDFPEHCGSFIVRWKENEDFVNRFLLEDIMEQIRKGRNWED